MFERVWSNLGFIWYAICVFIGGMSAVIALGFASVLLLNHNDGLGFLALLLISAVLGTISYGMSVFLALYWNRLRRRGQMSRTPERIARVLAKILDKFMQAI